VPVLSGSSIEPVAERGSECEVSVGVAYFEHCSPFSRCKGARRGLYMPVHGGGLLAKFVGVAVFSGDLLAVGGGDVGEEKYL
jgi:hypothetical protein